MEYWTMERRRALMILFVTFALGIVVGTVLSTWAIAQLTTGI